MKISFIFLSIFSITAKAQTITYTGSTPAGFIVRSFLGIALHDSVDFIRWQLSLHDDSYIIICNYGIAKPNTNGFINDGKRIRISGSLTKEKNIYELMNSGRTMRMIKLNKNLLHLLDTSNEMLAGNGGWSYTLNNIDPSFTDALNVACKQIIFKDSVAFEGRTPCNIPGVIPKGVQCYKLKWYMVLYTNNAEACSGTYKILATPYRSQRTKTGSWKITRQNDVGIMYRLNDDNGNAFLFLLNPGKNVLLFTNRNGNPLVGNEDFSYTLNRVATQ